VTGHSVFRLSLALDEIFWYAHGLAPRARKPRPSEKTDFHIIPGFSPKALSPTLAPRGGAGSARPRGAHGLDRGMCPVGQGPLASSSGQNGMPRHSWGLTTRTRRPRPSEKIGPRVSPGLPPRGHPSSGDQSRGGAGSARPQGKPRPDRGISPLGRWPLTVPVAAMGDLGRKKVVNLCPKGGSVPQKTASCLLSRWSAFGTSSHWHSDLPYGRGPRSISSLHSWP